MPPSYFFIGYRVCSTDYYFLSKLKTSIERLWTDYERHNQTHFWSETAKVLWTSKNNSQFMNYDDEYTYFDYHVVIDGYKKLRNVHATNAASCICIGSCSMIDFNAQS